MKSTTFALTAGTTIGGTGLLGLVAPHRSEAFRGPNKQFLVSKFMRALPTNVLFNWIRVGVGAAGILASRNERAAKIYNRALSLSYVGMKALGAIPKTETILIDRSLVEPGIRKPAKKTAQTKKRKVVLTPAQNRKGEPNHARLTSRN